MILVASLVIGFWFILGIIAGAYEYNFYQSRWPSIAEQGEPEDFRSAWGFSVFCGLISLIVAIEMGHCLYGPRFRRYKYINGVRQQ